MSTMVNTCAFLPGQTAFAARRLRASMPATVWVAGNPGLRRRAAAVELFTTLPDFHFTLEGAWGEGDRITWRGTNAGHDDRSPRRGPRYGQIHDRADRRVLSDGRR